MVVLVVRNYLGSSEPVSVDSYGLGNVSNRLLHEHACCGARQPGRARVLCRLVRPWKALIGIGWVSGYRRATTGAGPYPPLPPSAATFVATRRHFGPRPSLLHIPDRHVTRGCRFESDGALLRGPPAPAGQPASVRRRWQRTVCVPRTPSVSPLQ